MKGVTERDETTYAVCVSNADQKMRFSFIYLEDSKKVCTFVPRNKSFATERLR